MINLDQYTAPGSQARSQLARVNEILAQMQDIGGNSKEWQSQIETAIKSKDLNAINSSYDSLFKAYNDRLTFVQKAGKVDKEEQIGDMSVIADRIQSALKRAEDRNIALNPTDIQDAFEAELAGDTKEATRILKALELDFDNQRKEQVSETKRLETFADGTQVLVGEKTGTRYSSSGTPLSSGALNTSIYNKAVEQITGVPQEQQILQAQGTSTITRSPEVYEQPVQQKPSRLQESIAAMQEADRLYQSGDKKGALAILNAMKLSSFMGGSVTMDDLKPMFENEEEPMPDEAQDDRSKKTKSGTQYKVLD